MYFYFNYFFKQMANHCIKKPDKVQAKPEARNEEKMSKKENGEEKVRDN